MPSDLANTLAEKFFSNVHDAFFSDGMPKVVFRVEEEDDIMFVMDWENNRVPVWSDHRLTVYSRYDTHSYNHEWRLKEYEGDPRGPRKRDYTDYHASVEEALEAALQQQDVILREDGEQVPVFLNER